jgi:iron complex transport system ATP-binding protein
MHAAQHEFNATGLRLGYDDRTVIDGIDIAIEPGAVTVIIGANASGKSTLLRGLARVLKPRSGVITLDGNDIHQLPTKRLARLVGLLPQQPIAPEAISVSDLVSRGRYPHQGLFRQSSAADDAVVQAAMVATATLELADRRLEELSGGQRQRVWIAMALAQEPDILLLDEPTTFLDISHQVEVLDLLRELNAGNGATVVMVLHDLNLAARYADHLIVMAEGQVLASGVPAEVITPEVIAAAFGMPCVVIEDPVAGTPLVVPIGLHRPGAAG